MLYVHGELSQRLGNGVGVRYVYVLSLWLFNIYVNSCIRDTKVKVHDLNTSERNRALLGGRPICR